MYAHIQSGAVVDYPYFLRGADGGNPARAAKRLYPSVSPLPGDWALCSAGQLAALNAAPVSAVAAPALQDGETLAEGAPELVGGQWQQSWVVTPAPAPAPGVPDEVDSLAFELTLHSLGLHGAVTAYVETLPAVEQIYWRRRQTMRRDSTLIEAGRVALGLTPAQVDALFVAAGRVQA